MRSNRHEFRRRDVGRKEARATARSMTFISISSRPKETGRKNPVAPLFPSRNYSRIVPPFGSRRQKCLLLLLVQIGIFFHSPRMFGSRYSFVETFSISSIYRFVPLINLNGGGILAPFRSSVCIRGEIESNLVVKKVFTSRENRVTIITWKRGGTPEKRFHV